jgi:CBS domain-containing protein
MTSKLTVADLMPTGVKLVTVDEHASLHDAIRTLSSHNISSCPVVSAAGNPTGWIDWSGIISFLVNYVYETKTASTIAPRTTALAKGDLERLMELSSSHKIAAVLQASRPVRASNKKEAQIDNHEVPSVKAGDSIRKALALLSQGARSLPVVDDRGKIVGVLSQRDVLRFFATDPARLGEIGSNTVRGLSLATTRVACVRGTDVALDAFYMLASNHFGGAAIVDENGALLGNLSVSDIALVELDFTKLQSAVRSFSRWQSAPVTALETDTLAQVLGTMSSTKVRRVFLVNANHQPVGIITMTDVCKVIHRSLKPAKKPKKDVKAEEKKKQQAPKGGKKNKFEKHVEKEASKFGGKKKTTNKKKSTKK